MELVDTLDLGSSGVTPWRFKSSHSYQLTTVTSDLTGNKSQNKYEPLVMPSTNCCIAGSAPLTEGNIMPTYTVNEIKKHVEIARKLSLAILDPVVATTPIEMPDDEKRARAIGKAICDMSSVCSDGRDDIAKLLSVVCKLDIKPEYVNSRRSRHNKYNALTHADYTVIVPTTGDRGFAVNKPILVLDDGNYCMRGTGSVAGAGYIGDIHCRLATKTEINQFYDLVLAYTTISQKLSPKFILSDD